MTEIKGSTADDLALWSAPIAPEERIHHELLFFSQGPVDGYLSGDRSRDLFLHSRLPLTVLSKIWNLADVSNDNVLSIEEFVLAMHLILNVKEGLPVPRRLPKHLIPRVTTPPDIHDMSDREKSAYQNVFDSIGSQHISAIQGRLLLQESQLSAEELSHVWDLSDVNRDGQLDKDEWCVSCHLVRALKAGVALNGPVNVFKYIPQQLSPVSYQARKHRVDEYNKKKHVLMTAKERRRKQLESEKKKLELLKKRFALHTELYKVCKSTTELSIPEDEFLLYKEKEETNIDKVEAIVFRLKKEHERIRQETVKVILGEQGSSLQEDSHHIKREQDDVRQCRATNHTKATKDPDPFHQLYEQRKELRKRSTLSEGEEPEIHIPFTTNPFDRKSLIPELCGQSIFLSPAASVRTTNNSNNHKKADIGQDLFGFGERFIEKWCSTAHPEATDPEYDPIFMTLNVSMDTRGWSGMKWGEGVEQETVHSVHQKLVDLKTEMEKLTEDAGGHLLFRNPEDYLARRKAQEEEEKQEKSKYQRRHSEKRTEAKDKENVKKRASYAGPVLDEDTHRAVREYRSKRRSQNLDRTAEIPVTVDLGTPVTPDRGNKRVEAGNKSDDNIVKTSKPADSPRDTTGAASPRSPTSPARPSTKRKLAPPPPCANTSPKPSAEINSSASTEKSEKEPPVSAPDPCPRKSQTVEPPQSKIPQPESPIKPVTVEPPQSKIPQLASPIKPQTVEPPQSKLPQPASLIKAQTVESPQSKVPQPASPIKPQTVESPQSKVPQPASPIKPQTVESPQSKVPQPASQNLQPSRPPRRRKQSEENKSFLHESYEKDQRKDPKEIAVNVDIKENTDPVKTASVVKPSEDNVIEVKTAVVTDDIKQESRVVPSEDIDDFIDPLDKKSEEDSLLDTILKELPSLQNDKKADRIIANSQPVKPDTVEKVVVEDVFVAHKESDVECEIKPQVVKAVRGKYNYEDSKCNIEFQEVNLKPTSNKDIDSDNDNELITNITIKDAHSVSMEPDEVDEPVECINPVSVKKSSDIDLAFERIISFPEKEKSKDTISISSDISSTGSDAPPLPDSAPPPIQLERILSEEIQMNGDIIETMEMSTADQIESSPPQMEDDVLESEESLTSPTSLSPREEVASPISDLKAMMFSMRMTSPTRGVDSEVHTNGALSVDVDGKKETGASDSDVSDEDGGETRLLGTFSPGSTMNENIPTETHVDDGSIQLISYTNKLHSPGGSDQSGPDSAFEDMQSSMTSNDTLSNTLDDIVQEECVISERVDRTESAPPKHEVVTNEANKFGLALEKTNKSKSSEVRSPVGSKDFMTKAQQFADTVQKPPLMRVKLKREGTNPDDLTDEKCLQMEAERRAVISMSMVKKRNVDGSTPQKSSQVSEGQYDQEDTQIDEQESPPPESSIQEWRADVSKRSNIPWDEKPDKVNLYSENVIQENENTEAVDRDSIANLSSIRQHWETKLKPTDDIPKQTQSKQQVKHWEVKLPVPLKKVPADVPAQTNNDSSDSDSEKMADTEYANESAIEREIRLATEREELLRKEKEERSKIMEKQQMNGNSSKPVNKEVLETSEEQNNNKPTYNEMTEADRGSDLQQRQEAIEREIQELEEREEALRAQARQDERESSSEDDDLANESIIEREIRLQQERERELEERKLQSTPKQKVVEPVQDQIVEEVVTVENSEPVESSLTSTPDQLSEADEEEVTHPTEIRTRISYEEAISQANHDGESLIARELREAREREDELEQQRQRSSVNGPPTPTPTKSAPAPSPTVKTESVKPTYQKDVSPYKTNRKQSQDSLSSHSTEKSQTIVTPRSNVKVTTFGGKIDKLAYKTPDQQNKPKQKKPETPIEREIRLAWERENEYRISKGLSPLKPEKKVESSEDEKEEEEVVTTKSSFFSSPSYQNKESSSQRMASSRLQKEINKQTELEKAYLNEGKILSTSEEHVGIVKYTDLAPQEQTTTPKRNFSIARKTKEPVVEQNGTHEPKVTPKVQTPEQPQPKFGRSVSSSGGVTFSYKESRHKAESKIEQELREMREREEELRSQRAGAGLVSPRGPESPRSPDTNKVMNKRSQFEQTA